MKPKILTTLETYSWPTFASDCLAGATVAMVAIPLSLAIAIASGADPAKGLVTAIIGGFFISLLGGSRVQIGGPTGAFIVVVFGVIADHGYDGLVIATFMAGLILLAAGFLRIGNLIAYIPEAVIDGFTIGIAVIIAKSQLADFLGLTGGVTWKSLFADPGAFFGGVNAAAVGIGLVTMAVIIALRKAFPRLPGLIVAVAATSAVVAFAGLDVDTIVSRFGELPNQLPVPEIPALSLERIKELLPSAFVIAFLAGVESLLSAMVADRAIGGSHRPNAEVIAQGTANLASSLFGGMPATGAIARTATNIRAGGKTPVAGIVHALVILAVMMLAAPLAGYLAMPAMAALLILTAWNMSEPHRWREYLTVPNSDKMLLVVTLVLTVAVDLTVAIGVGVGLGLAIRLRNRKRQREEWHTPKR